MLADGLSALHPLSGVAQPLFAGGPARVGKQVEGGSGVAELVVPDEQAIGAVLRLGDGPAADVLALAVVREGLDDVLDNVLAPAHGGAAKGEGRHAQAGREA